MLKKFFLLLLVGDFSISGLQNDYIKSVKSVSSVENQELEYESQQNDVTEYNIYPSNKSIDDDKITKFNDLQNQKIFDNDFQNYVREERNVPNNQDDNEFELNNDHPIFGD